MTEANHRKIKQKRPNNISETSDSIGSIKKQEAILFGQPLL
jgi:hypothetical protein